MCYLFNTYVCTIYLRYMYVHISYLKPLKIYLEIFHSFSFLKLFVLLNFPDWDLFGPNPRTLLEFSGLILSSVKECQYYGCLTF